MHVSCIIVKCVYNQYVLCYYVVLYSLRVNKDMFCSVLPCSYDKWDHRFFGVNEIEADVMDPQQKLVLDCVYMAMEDGGIVSKDIEKTRTGVYIGILQASRPVLIKHFLLFHAQLG